MEIYKTAIDANIILTDNISIGLLAKSYQDIKLEKSPSCSAVGDKWLLTYYGLRMYIEPSDANKLIELGCKVL
jgi:hypothetical protein